MTKKQVNRLFGLVLIAASYLPAAYLDTADELGFVAVYSAVVGGVAFLVGGLMFLTGEGPGE